MDDTSDGRVTVTAIDVRASGRAMELTRLTLDDTGVRIKHSIVRGDARQCAREIAIRLRGTDDTVVVVGKGKLEAEAADALRAFVAQPVELVERECPLREWHELALKVVARHGTGALAPVCMVAYRKAKELRAAKPERIVTAIDVLPFNRAVQVVRLPGEPCTVHDGTSAAQLAEKTAALCEDDVIVVGHDVYSHMFAAWLKDRGIKAECVDTPRGDWERIRPQGWTDEYKVPYMAAWVRQRERRRRSITEGREVFVDWVTQLDDRELHRAFTVHEEQTIPPFKDLAGHAGQLTQQALSALADKYAGTRVELGAPSLPDCPDCKNTGQITLLFSTVRCGCGR